MPGFFYLLALKKSETILEHSSEQMPEDVSVLGCRSEILLPSEDPSKSVKPRLGSSAPHTRRSNCAQHIAAAHIGQGSTVTYSVHPVRYLPPIASHADVMAIISAWAVGSWRRSVMLCPLAIMRPRQTMTAPMGTSPSAEAACASRKASRMNNSSGSTI